MSQIFQATSVMIPIFFVLILGFCSGKVKAFGKNRGEAISVINELVLTFALPASLFVGTMSVTKKQLVADINLFISLLICSIIGYVIGFFFAKLLFKRNIIESAIAGLAVAFSAGPFYGPALLGDLYGSSSSVAVSLVSMILNVIIVPLTTIIIKIEIERASKQHDSVAKLIGKSLFDSIFKVPFVWAPLLAFIFVFFGVSIPQVALSSLNLMGEASAGMAVFVAGLTISAYKFKVTTEVVVISVLKNIVLPLIFIGTALLLNLKFGSVAFNEGLLLTALPSGPMIVLFSTKYKQYQQEASSILAFSTIGMLVTVNILIVILGV